MSPPAVLECQSQPPVCAGQKHWSKINRYLSETLYWRFLNKVRCNPVLFFWLISNRYPTSLWNWDSAVSMVKCLQNISILSSLLDFIGRDVWRLILFCLNHACDSKIILKLRLLLTSNNILSHINVAWQLKGMIGLPPFLFKFLSN